MTNNTAALQCLGELAVVATPSTVLWLCAAFMGTTGSSHEHIQTQEGSLSLDSAFLCSAARIASTLGVRYSPLCCLTARKAWQVLRGPLRALSPAGGQRQIDACFCGRIQPQSPKKSCRSSFTFQLTVVSVTVLLLSGIPKKDAPQRAL